jgi:hypothetical protein
VATRGARPAAEADARDHFSDPRFLPPGSVARDELIAAHGADYAMPNLLNHLAAPDCSRVGSQWDRCGVHCVDPIEGAR